jgi:hypothetical protein
MLETRLVRERLGLSRLNWCSAQEQSNVLKRIMGEVSSMKVRGYGSSEIQAGYWGSIEASLFGRLPFRPPARLTFGCSNLADSLKNW